MMLPMTRSIEFDLLLLIAILLPVIPAYILYKTLPSRTAVSGPFKGLNIDLTGAFAGYFLVLLVAVWFTHHYYPPLRDYEVWTVEGKVMPKGSNSHQQILQGGDLSILPSKVTLWPSGGASTSFSVVIPITLDQSNKPDFPYLLVSPPGYSSETIPLKEQSSPFGSKPYKLNYDFEAKKITISDIIELDSSPEGEQP